VARPAASAATVALLAWSTLSLAACAPVGPNYKRPAMPVPAQYRFDERARAESLADLPWWQLFADPPLQALVREAIANNLDLRAAAARVDEARARAGIVRSFLFPTVDGVASYAVQQTQSDDDVLHGGTYGLASSWELDLFGRIRREHESALAILLATEQGRRGVLVTLIGDVATTYFQLRELDVQLDLARRTLRVNDQTVDYFTTRLNGGVSNRLEVDQVRSNRQQTAATVYELEQQIAVTEDALSLLLGRPPTAIVRSMAVLEPPTAPPVPPGLPASLLERRPDVMQAEALLVAANADIGAARALFFPAISLTGFAGGVSGDVATLLGGPGFAWSLGSNLLQPIYNAGRNRRTLEAARAHFEAARAEYQKAALNGYREVSNALVAIQKLAAARAERLVGVAVLQDAADLARDRYSNGVATSLEILIADQQLFQQQLLLAQTVGAEFRARADLYRALGGGWQQ
jgi:multidrug efflux system outer membrane protein